ncbi:MAG: DNA-3-methyladenine glycosylase I [Dehalococcoidia bacterium]|nr:DNA-3-methyladenine glycosylase I [Dehalococcoidia bacterium]
MEAPQQVDATSLADYLEVMTKAVFQSGMSWAVVEAKWPGFRAAFHDFDPDRVALTSPDELDALTSDARIIRNRKKIEATIENARTMVALAHEHGSFPAYLGSHDGFEATVKDLRRRFKFMGEMGCFYFLYVVRESVPTYEEWCVSRGRVPVHG